MRCRIHESKSLDRPPFRRRFRFDGVSGHRHGFGLMLETAGYGVGWALLMSMTIYAGSGQYLGVSLLATGASLSQAAFLTLMINFRHLVYGLSMLEKYRAPAGRGHF